MLLLVNQSTFARGKRTHTRKEGGFLIDPAICNKHHNLQGTASSLRRPQCGDFAPPGKQNEVPQSQLEAKQIRRRIYIETRYFF